MFKNYRREYLTKDIVSGIIVALISIPISMGYSQVAGLPVVYGLYGSLFPIIVFGLISSSPQFVFGVDAAPAALVGGTIASLGIASGSDEAMRVVPVITFVTACWLMLFFIVRAGKLVNYISKPVLGGFISGIGCTIILMQVAKLFGGTAGTGEVVELVGHIISERGSFNLLSFIMGIGTIIIVLVSKKISRKFPMSVIMMLLGALSTAVFHVDSYGVKLLPKVEPGLPEFKMIDFSVLTEYPSEIITLGLTVALVIVSSTLLTACNYAIKNDYKIKNNREILAYSMSNFCAAFNGCCPLNGSVSRTGIAEQFGVKSQVMSLVAALTMAIIVLFGTGFIAYLPVPVLTGIVISALIGILEFGMAKKLWKTDKVEFAIFMGAFLGVLVFGTIYGVVIGVLLSFVSVIIKASVPPRGFLGVIPGQNGFYDMERNRNAHTIKGAVIYRFSGTLFFANINVFVRDIENAVTPDIKLVIVDASGIGSIDITAADRLVIMAEKLRNKGIRFYLTEHVGYVNDLLRKLGAGELIDIGAVRRTISLALRDSGIVRPYPLEDRDGVSPMETVLERNDELAEFEWAFGDEAEERMEKLALEVAGNVAGSNLTSTGVIRDAEQNVSWGRIGLFDEDELLDRLEMHLSEIAQRGNHDPKLLEERIEERRSIVEKKLADLNPDAIKALKEHRRKLALHFKETNPEAYEHMLQVRREHIERLEKSEPKLAEKLKELYNHGEDSES